ncbi:MAG: VWA domain-containing protein [Deltaproteobacteria bacterium]|nr:VWA domain-containing protein [Deltaproteobacteria bacterium]
MTRFLLAILLTLAGCASDLSPVPGTAVRISEPEQGKDTDLKLRFFTSESDCAALDPADRPHCLPWVDRASGEVHLAFRFFLGADVWPVPITRDEVEVLHQGSVIQEGQNEQSLDLVPHDPVRAQQLFIVLIDGSASMNEPVQHPRIERVRAALLTDGVVHAFFPEQVRTGVLLLAFTGSQVRPVGGEMKVIERPREYRRLVRNELAAQGGYTHLYNAVRYATGPLLTDVPQVRSFLQAANATPTVIALTDGFNNEARDDTCGRNAPRLEALLEHLVEVRHGEGDLRTRPQVFTVGLGRPFHPSFELPDRRERVDPALLCRRKYVNAPIDGYLEAAGIDNASLTWIADAGGGRAYVKQDATGLGEAFQAAAAERYEWFEARYRLDPFYLRRSFRTTVRLLAFANAEASVRIHPSGWFDGPPGMPQADGWTSRSSLRQTTGLVLPLLGLFLTFGLLPPAFFNARRILGGRIRGQAPRPTSAGAPLPPGTPPQGPTRTPPPVSG